MKDAVLQTACWGVALNIAGYMVGCFLRRKLRTPLANPILVSVVCVAAVLCAFDIPFEAYRASSEPLSYLLAPATAALALPMYEKLEILRSRAGAIILSVAAGVFAGMAGVLLICAAFGAGHAAYATMLTKSVTVPIGMGISREIGGIEPLALAVIILTGIIGHIFAGFLCRVFGITNPVAKGLALGNCSHVLGATKAFEMGEVEGAMGTVAVLVAGVITAFASLAFAGLY